jgi:hypothetical protein
MKHHLGESSAMLRSRRRALSTDQSSRELVDFLLSFVIPVPNHYSVQAVTNLTF